MSLLSCGTANERDEETHYRLERQVEHGVTRKETGMLTKEQVNFFNTFGFLVLRQLFTGEPPGKEEKSDDHETAKIPG